VTDHGTIDLFSKTVVDLRVKGYSFEQIAEREETSPAEVVRAWKAYVENRQVMGHEEWLVLHELRLEELLKAAWERLNAGVAATAGDLGEFKTLLAILEQIEKLQGLNKERKAEAVEVLARINEIQSRVILVAFETLRDSLRVLVDNAFENNKTIKAIRAEVSDVFDSQIMPVAQQALLAPTSEQEQ
jgi:hypothetical protein